MKTAWNSFHAALTAVGGALGVFLGGWDGFLYALVAFTVIDYLTGVMCAIVDKKLSSEIGAKGIFKKVLIFALVGVGHTLDAHILGNGSVVRNMVIFFFAANEGVSLLENAARIGLPIPPKLKDILTQLNNGGGKSK